MTAWKLSSANVIGILVIQDPSFRLSRIQSNLFELVGREKGRIKFNNNFKNHK